MSNVDTKRMKGELWVTYSEAAYKKAYSKYSFEFTIHGVAYRVWYDLEKDTTFFDCGDKADTLFPLTEEIDRLIYEGHSKNRIDIIDLHKFVCKHLRTMIKVLQEMQRAPASERCNQVLYSNGEVSCLEELLAEVTQEQKERAN
jgi:hypothetical protein